MKIYNDYHQVIERYLREYNYFRVAIDNLEKDLKDKQEEISTISAPIAKYGDSGGGCYSEETKIEQEAFRRMKIENDISDIQYNLKELKRLIEKIDKAVKELEKDQQEAIELIYMQRMTLYEASARMNYSTDWCRKIKNKAIRHIAQMVFGLKAHQGQKYNFIS